ncbi:OmpP1/FadL family transporter [Sediminitomix flava]|nr:outer membrane protein transport protein [Sediminitomix flava]
MKNKQTIFFFLLLLPFSALAQIEPIGFYKDAVRFSKNELGGDARIQALGGSGISLGGNMSNAYLNPAGLAFYRKSEMSITGVVSINQTTATNNTDFSTEKNTNFNLPQFGFVIKGESKGAFSISFNQLQNFNNTTSYFGRNDGLSSITKEFTEANYGYYAPDPNWIFSPAEAAYQLGLVRAVDPSDPDNYDYYNLVNTAPDSRSGYIETRGGHYQFDVGYGEQINNQLSWGVSVGIPYFNYNMTRYYEENQSRNYYVINGVEKDLPTPEYIGLNESIRSESIGINAKLGLIYKQSDRLRLGFTFETPTFYRVTDQSSFRLATQWDTNSFDEKSFVQDFLGVTPNDSHTGAVTSGTESSVYPLQTSYNLRTPMKASIGASYFFGKSGFITFDAEYVAYNQMKISNGYDVTFDSDVDFIADNDILSEEHKGRVNIRTGAEYRLNKNFYLRGGYAYYPDPTEAEYRDVDQSTQYITGGLGYRNANFFIDFAFINTQSNSSYQPFQLYAPDPVPVYDIDNNTNQVVFTLGKSF